MPYQFPVERTPDLRITLMVSRKNKFGVPRLQQVLSRQAEFEPFRGVPSDTSIEPNVTRDGLACESTDIEHAVIEFEVPRQRQIRPELELVMRITASAELS